MSLNGSQDVFEDSSEENEKPWLGVSLDDLKSKDVHTYPSVRPSHNHTVLFKLPLDGNVPEPHPTKKTDVWDFNHVRMPHSSQSLYPVSDNELKLRWDLIKNALKSNLTSSKDLEKAIFSYNSKLSQRWSFDTLHTFFSETLGEEEITYFFKTILPGIVNLALEIEDKFRGGVPLLRRGSNRSISMSQEQAGILLANAFLCTYPRRNSFNENCTFPSINFNSLFQCGSSGRAQHKLKCFLNYFRRILKNRPKGVITYSRRHVKPNELPVWSEREDNLCKLHITTEGTIEKEGAGLMEVDFANKYVGGGVLGRGSVQEEIKFLICPELVVSRLFTECLDETEALIVTGCETFNKFKGYASSFTWDGNYKEKDLKCDSYKRLNSVVLAIDATYFDQNSPEQFSIISINRELNKAYSGFSFGSLGNIATGNWGCGAFNGDPRLKALIQIMAASVCDKHLAYFTFGDKSLRDDIFKMYNFLIIKSVTVGMLYQIIAGFSDKKCCGQKNGSMLYEYIYDMLDTNLEKISLLKTNEEDLNIEEYSFSESETSDKQKDELKIEEYSMTESEISDVVNSQNIEDVSSQNEKKDDSFKRPEPKSAESYSLKTEEGRKRCIETENQRWNEYEKTMSKFSEINSRLLAKKTVKRKITDYFNKNS